MFSPPQQQTCQVWVGNSFEILNYMYIDFWMNKIQDRTQSSRSLLFKVFNVSVTSFHVYFDKQVHKKTGKKLSKQKKNSNLEFCWIKCAAALRHGIFIFSFFNLKVFHFIFARRCVWECLPMITSSVCVICILKWLHQCVLSTTENNQAATIFFFLGCPVEQAWP